MSRRPKSFDDIKGHPMKVAYLVEQIANHSLPHFILFEGEEGLGKTSLAELVAISLVHGLEDSPEKDAAIRQVIDNRKSTTNIKKYAMSEDGGKAVAKEVLAEFNTGLVSGNKVIICDECQGMSDAAQDVLLEATDTGCIPDNLYIIALTTEKSNLKATLLSRMVPIHLNRLKGEDMLQVLRDECVHRGVEIQGGDATLSLIAEWSEYKPRTALSLLGAFGDHSKVSASLIKELIGYTEVGDVLPLVTSLAGSFTWGLSYIDELQIDTTFVDVVLELLKLRCGCPSYKLRLDEARKAKEQIMVVPEENLRKFAYLISGTSRCTRNTVVSAFIQSHVSSAKLETYNNETLADERIQKSTEAIKPVKSVASNAAPTIEDLLANSTIVG